LSSTTSTLTPRRISGGAIVPISIALAIIRARLASVGRTIVRYLSCNQRFIVLELFVGFQRLVIKEYESQIGTTALSPLAGSSLSLHE
jgi:hypothetical protein